MRNQYEVWAVSISGYPAKQHVCCVGIERATEWAQVRLKAAIQFNNSLEFKMLDPTITGIERVCSCERWPDA